MVNELIRFLLTHINLESMEKPLLCLTAIKKGECNKGKGKEEVEK